MGRRLLVVDDQQALRNFLVRLIKAEGLEVIEAEGGEQAWHLLETGTTVDAILTDIVMPAGSGLELARRVRDSGRSVKLWFMTGFAGDELEEATREFPEWGILHKPFQLQDLRLALTRLGLLGSDRPCC